MHPPVTFNPFFSFSTYISAFLLYNRLIFLIFLFLSIAHAMLYDSFLSECDELIEVKAKGGKDHLYVHPRHRSNQHVSSLEYPFNCMESK